MKNKTKSPKCLVPGCANEAKTRGLCPTHYNYVCRLIREKRTTWAKLERNKKVLPRRRKKTTGSTQFFLGDE